MVKPDNFDLEAFLVKRGRIRAEFERCKRQGLPPPSWSDLGEMTLVTVSEPDRGSFSMRSSALQTVTWLDE